MDSVCGDHIDRFIVSIISLRTNQLRAFVPTNGAIYIKLNASEKLMLMDVLNECVPCNVCEFP